jgi:hypothetical protein
MMLVLRMCGEHRKPALELSGGTSQDHARRQLGRGEFELALAMSRYLTRH